MSFLGSTMQDKLFKSLVIIVTVNVGGYFINLGLMLLALTYFPWPFNWYQFEANGVLLNIAAAANAPILYLTRFSSDKAARKN